MWALWVCQMISGADSACWLAGSPVCRRLALEQLMALTVKPIRAARRPGTTLGPPEAAPQTPLEPGFAGIAGRNGFITDTPRCPGVTCPHAGGTSGPIHTGPTDAPRVASHG